jgi:1,2-phenylacetyl-CoA epoxidase PaaB subunit
MNMLDEGEVYEVFQQDQKDPVPHHGGNLLAPDTELALHYAKEFYGRRQESQRLWIVPRSALLEISDLAHPMASTHALIHENLTQEEIHQAFAVFGQKQAAKALLWIQDTQEISSLVAPETAIQLAQESTVRYLRLWLCPRTAILELTNPDLLQPPLDRSYRRLDGYNIREKLRVARQRVAGRRDI